MESQQYTIQSNYLNDKLPGIITCFIALLMMLLSCNKLIAVVPLDKVVLLLVVLFYIPNAIKISMYAFSRGEKQALMMLCLVILVSLLANSDTFSFQLFLPVVGFIFSIFLSQSYILLKGIYYGSFMHILIANIIGLGAYAFGWAGGTVSLANKGLPMLKSIMGFTPTPQSFGTLCLSWLIIYFFLKERGKIKRIDKFFYLLVTVGIILSINRTTYIGYLLILFFKERRLFYTYLSISAICVVIFWNILMDTIFSTATLDSREELLDGFNRSFWNSDSWQVYLFGKADNKIAEKYIRYATWDEREDIENGFAMILHMLGFLGLGYYLSTVFIFARKTFKKKYFYECSLFLFFCIFTTFITQEFVATTFYIALGVVMYIYKNNYAASKKSTGVG